MKVKKIVIHERGDADFESALSLMEGKIIYLQIDNCVFTGYFKEKDERTVTLHINEKMYHTTLLEKIDLWFAIDGEEVETEQQSTDNTLRADNDFIQIENKFINPNRVAFFEMGLSKQTLYIYYSGYVLKANIDKITPSQRSELKARTGFDIDEMIKDTEVHK